jgi:hypothetical protein
MASRIVIREEELTLTHFFALISLLQYGDVFGRVHHSIDDVITTNTSDSHAASDCDFQRMLHAQVQAINSTKPPHMHMCVPGCLSDRK